MGSRNLKRYTPYQPYIKEGVFSLNIDLLVCFVGGVFLIWLGITKTNPWFLLVFPLYLLVECFWNYRIMLLSILEVNLELYKKEQLQLLKIKKAPEFVGKWETILSWVYPDHKYIEKNILYFKRTDGSIVRLRCVFYGADRKPRSRAVSSSKEGISGFDEVVYGRYSKVIIFRTGMAVRKSGLWNRSNYSKGN